MHVVIAEAQFIGHYYTYVRRVLEAVRGLDCRVSLLVSPEGLKSKEFATNLAPALQGENVSDCLRMPRMGMLRGTMDMIRVVRDAVKSTRADHLLVPSADNVAQAVGLASLGFYRPFPSRVQAEGLMTKLSFVYPGAERTIPHQLIMAGLRRSPWTRLHTIDLLAYQWLRNNAPKLAEQFSLIPDPVEEFAQLTKQEARRKLGLPEDGRCLVCPGILIYRKGVGLLLEAFLAAKTRPTDRILLAGPVGDDVAATLRDSRYEQLVRDRRVLVVDRYLDVEGMGQAFCAGDVTVCPYPQQWHPSSIAIKSLACNRPVLGADSFWLGSMIPAFEMGWTVPVHDPQVFSRTIELALEESAGWKRSDAAGRLVRFQSVERFQECWLAGLKERLGLEPVKFADDGNEIIAAAGLANYGRLRNWSKKTSGIQGG